MKLTLALACALGLVSANALACYTVYDRAGRVAYSGDRPPVDMSRPLHETLPQRFPGGHMVFDSLVADCPRTLASESASIGALNRGSSSPLLTDERTATAMRLPHTNVDGIAVVSADVASRVNVPHFTVVPTDQAALAYARASGMNTTTMGAGPAAPARAATAPATAPQRRY